MSLCASRALHGDREGKVLLVFIFFKKAGGGGGGEKEAGWEVHVHILHLETPRLCASAGRPHNERLCGPGARRARRGMEAPWRKCGFLRLGGARGQTGSGFVLVFGRAQ